MSVGVAIYQAMDTGHSIVSRADEALYAAKNAGRNLVKTELDLTENPNQENVA
ncbi:diguanylate cyclase domain-containing protein [Roseibium sp.]|uniref:diguanylate cyclase domain-containing protein n=1 Tax=Roseibium sp. TaxID=1936156 RepID=UPI003D0E9373